jgi:hypothetical protein
VVVVRGPLVAESWGCSRALRERAERDRQHVDRTLAALCRELRLHYTGRRVAPSYGEVRRYRGPDRLHLNAEGHRRQGTGTSPRGGRAWCPRALYLERSLREPRRLYSLPTCPFAPVPVSGCCRHVTS